MKFTHTLIALAIASSAAIAPSAFAQSADLSITGKIFPGACTVSLASGGIADFGDIRADSLNENGTTALPPVELAMTVDCESNVRFAIEGVDNVPATSPSALQFGLGVTPADEKIGNAYLTLHDVDADGQTVYGTASHDNGSTWGNSGTQPVGGFAVVPAAILGFATEQAVVTGPAPIKSLTSMLQVSPSIRPANQLTLTEDVQINGSVTLNVVYL